MGDSGSGRIQAILPEEKLRNSTFLGKWRQRNMQVYAYKKKKKWKIQNQKKKKGNFSEIFQEFFGSDEKINMDKNQNRH